jgi:hypothetical protein
MVSRDGALPERFYDFIDFEPIQPKDAFGGFLIHYLNFPIIFCYTAAGCDRTAYKRSLFG